MKNNDDNEEAEADKPLLERLKIRRTEAIDPIPHPVLRKVTSKLIAILDHEVNCDNNFLQFSAMLFCPLANNLTCVPQQCPSQFVWCLRQSIYLVFLFQYIAYARRYVHPKISPAAAKVLQARFIYLITICSRKTESIHTDSN